MVNLRDYEDKVAKRAFADLEKTIAKEVDLVHRHADNMRQRAYFRIWDKVFEQMALKQRSIKFLEAEADQREDSLNRYLDYQSRPCPTCHKYQCIEHCNFCGDSVKFKKKPDLFLMQKSEYHNWRSGKFGPNFKPKHYPANLNDKPHLLCRFKKDPDYAQMVVDEERRLGLQWLPGESKTPQQSADEVRKSNAAFFSM